ncbi:MAG: Asp-tRNA(Asn)/Glu-tRNA(Gln) amidotransferase subunit GatC [Planctomycetota bacterium]
MVSTEDNSAPGAAGGAPSGDVTAETVRRLAALARLTIDDDAIEGYRRDLSSVLRHAACLAEADLEGVEPMARACAEVNRLADDEPGPTLDAETVARLAPAWEEGFIPVPKVLGDTPTDSGEGGS